MLDWRHFRGLLIGVGVIKSFSCIPPTSFSRIGNDLRFGTAGTSGSAGTFPALPLKIVFRPIDVEGKPGVFEDLDPPTEMRRAPVGKKLSAPK